MKNLEQLLAWICNGNEEAFDFLAKWQSHCHRVDDIVDREIIGPENILEAFVKAQDLMLHPFFARHHDKLYSLHILAANAYCDSCELSKSAKEGDQKLADVLRSYGNEMMLIVAGICCSADEDVWTKIRSVSRYLRQHSWENHHDKEGRPI